MNRTQALLFAGLSSMAALALATLGLATGAAAPEWLSREYSKGWNLPGASAEQFLNDECRPSGFDGIQLLAVQKDHGSPYNLHVYCRKDGATARYKVSMVTFARGKLGDGTKQIIGKPKVLMGPFYFGNEGEGDGILAVEKLR
jgi:hypothetical protein